MKSLVGNKFNRWTVLSRAENKGHRERYLCLCDCGKKSMIRTDHLKNGGSRSCGCLSVGNRKTHGMHKTKVYAVWAVMRARCNNPKDKGFKNYGGRGIKVCEEWSKFENFIRDMGERPMGMSIDRVDNDGDYCKSNCRWTTRSVQENNKRSNARYEFEGKNLTQAQWAQEVGIGYGTLQSRILRLGWSIEKALTTPPRKIRK